MEQTFLSFLSREKVSINSIDPLNARSAIFKRLFNIPSVLKAFYEINKKSLVRFHPDKGGNPHEFNKIMTAIGLLRFLLDIVEGDKNHSELKSAFQSESESESYTNPTRISKDEFNRRWEQTNAHVFDEHHNKGYGNIMKTESDIIMSGGIPMRRNIDIERMSESTPRRFNEEFKCRKQSATGAQVIPYTPPMASNDNGAGSTTTFLELGREINSFTVPESATSISYTDYRDAFEQPFLIDESHVQQPSPRNVEELIRIRKDTNMSQEQQLAVENNDMLLEIDEIKRLERLRNQQRHYLK